MLSDFSSQVIEPFMLFADSSTSLWEERVGNADFWQNLQKSVSLPYLQFFFHCLEAASTISVLHCKAGAVIMLGHLWAVLHWWATMLLHFSRVCFKGDDILRFISGWFSQNCIACRNTTNVIKYPIDLHALHVRPAIDKLHRLVCNATQGDIGRLPTYFQQLESAVICPWSSECFSCGICFDLSSRYRNADGLPRLILSSCFARCLQLYLLFNYCLACSQLLLHFACALAIRS